MELYLEQTLREFKKLLRNFTGLPPSKMRLFHNIILQGQFIKEKPLRHLDKPLYQFKFDEEDEILIEKPNWSQLNLLPHNDAFWHIEDT